MDKRLQVEFFPDKNNIYMFESFEEYAAIMHIDKEAPNYTAFQIVWNMARTPASTFGSGNQKGKNEQE